MYLRSQFYITGSSIHHAFHTMTSGLSILCLDDQRPLYKTTTFRSHTHSVHNVLRLADVILSTFWELISDFHASHQSLRSKYSIPSNRWCVSTTLDRLTWRRVGQKDIANILLEKQRSQTSAKTSCLLCLELCASKLLVPEDRETQTNIKN